MIVTETRSLIELRNSIENRLSETYEEVFEIEGKKCFKSSGNDYFIISALSWDNGAIVAEYADSLQAAQQGIFGEDGHIWYIEESTEDEICEGLISEIED